MNTSRLTLAACLFFYGSNCWASIAVNLDFNAPDTSAIKDKNGLGTGFTTRLPGTGSALPTNDPNMDLLGIPGRLLLTSTHADTNQSPGPTGNNLPILEAPGAFVAGVGSADLAVKALFENAQVPNGNDHLMVYVGVNENLLISAGIHQLDVFMLSKNVGTGDQNSISNFNAFSPGDDIEITLSRTSSLWTLSWKNLTDASSGALPSISIPELDAHPDLYFGVLASNAGLNPQGSPESFVAQIDYFTVEVVPESTSALVFLLLISSVTFVRHRQM